MTTITIEAYTYAELDSSAKTKVQQWWAQAAPDPWHEDQEYWLEQLGALGYEGIDFQYSGFYSQGDGASIACSVNLPQFIKRNKLGNRFGALRYWARQVFGDGGAVDVRRENWGHYVHDKLLYANVDNLKFDLWNGVDVAQRANVERAIRQAEEIGPLVLDEVREWSVKIYQSLQSDYESWFEDEHMIDLCDANGYLFDRFGDPVHHLRKAA